MNFALKNLLTGLIIIFAFGLISPQARAATAPTQVFIIDFTVNRTDLVRVNAVALVAGSLPDFVPGQAGGEARLISLDGAVLARAPFSTDLTVYDLDVADPTVPELRQTLRLPYYLTANTVELWSGQTILGTVNLVNYLCPVKADNQCSEYCKFKGADSDCRTCGNGLCEPGEANSCPTDCNGALVPAGQNDVIIWLIGVGALIVAISGGIWWWRRRVV